MSAASWASRLSSSAWRARSGSASSSIWARAIDSRWKAAAAAASASRSSGSRCAPTRLLLGGVQLLGRARSATAAVASASACLASRLLRLGSGPAQMQQRRLGPADLGREVLEAGGLARLALQAVDLRLELADHVVEPLEVLLGGLQPQLGLVAARMQAGDAGGLLEQRAARLRLGLDQLADAALADHRGRARAGRLRRRTAAARRLARASLPLMR